MHINREKRIQQAAIAWLETHRGYREVFSDIEARGARMDSAGTIDDRLVLIEVKPSVTPGLTKPGPDGAGEIECKISATLRGLYKGHPNELSTSTNAIWDRRRPPLVVLLAESWEKKSRADLVAMAARRASEWVFDWAFWQWKGDRLETLEDGRTDHVSGPSNTVEWKTIDIPILRATAGRPANRTIDQLKMLAADNRVAELFDAFRDAANSVGRKTVNQMNGFGITARGIPGYKTDATVISIYLDRSTSGRIAVGCDLNSLDVAQADLPGIACEKKFGHQTDNRWLTTPEEVWRLLAVPLKTVE